MSEKSKIACKKCDVVNCKDNNFYRHCSQISCSEYNLFCEADVKNKTIYSRIMLLSENTIEACKIGVKYIFQGKEPVKNLPKFLMFIFFTGWYTRCLKKSIKKIKKRKQKIDQRIYGESHEQKLEDLFLIHQERILLHEEIVQNILLNAKNQDEN